MSMMRRCFRKSSGIASVLLVIVALVLLTACGSDYDNTGNSSNEADKFVFASGGMRIELRAPSTELPTALEYFDAPSCIFEGYARVYMFDGFKVEAFPLGDTEVNNIIAIVLLDASVTTTRGIRIGDTYDDMVRAYGSDYETFPGGDFSFTENGNTLSFNLWQGVIEGIMYFVEDLHE